MENFWCLVFTLVFHCCLCHSHVGPQLKKYSAPAGFRIANLAPAGFEKIISGATLLLTISCLSVYSRNSWQSLLLLF